MKALFPWVSNCMWILRFLNGPLAGQVLPLKKSPIVLGRAPNCDIKIPSGSVSKEHTRLELFDDKLIVSDMGSRNGTFVNGVQVRSSKVRPGDKINMHDILFEVQKMPDTWAAHMHAPFPGYGPASRSPGYSYGAAAVQSHPTSGYAPRADAEMNADLASDGFPRWATLGREYMDRVVLPGVYHLPKIFEFRWVLAGFMAAFILLVTTLSTIPLIRILKQSIEETSQQHALTIATTLARVNRPFLISGQESASSVEIATSRPGVSRAYLISNIDGNIVAPAAQAGSFPDLPYVHEGRKRSQDSVKQVDDNTVIAMVPVMVFNQDTGQQAVTHWAVIQYDMSALAVDNAQILSLFISTLFIALLLGGMLFYFLYKVVEYPIRSMNLQLDVALKEGHETVSTDYQFPSMQLLAANVSSALTRALSGAQNVNANRGLEHDRNRECANLVELVGFAAMAVRAADLSIAAVNQAFESRLGMSAAQLTTIGVNELSDQALKLSVKDLVERVDSNPDDIASNELEFSGLNYQVVAQAVFGTNAVSYYLIVLLPVEGEE